MFSCSLHPEPQSLCSGENHRETPEFLFFSVIGNESELKINRSCCTDTAATVRQKDVGEQAKPNKRHHIRTHICAVNDGVKNSRSYSITTGRHQRTVSFSFNLLNICEALFKQSEGQAEWSST